MKVLIISSNTLPASPAGPAYIAGLALRAGLCPSLRESLLAKAIVLSARGGDCFARTARNDGWRGLSMAYASARPAVLARIAYDAGSVIERGNDPISEDVMNSRGRAVHEWKSTNKRIKPRSRRSYSLIRFFIRERPAPAKIANDVMSSVRRSGYHGYN